MNIRKLSLTEPTYTEHVNLKLANVFLSFKWKTSNSMPHLLLLQMVFLKEYKQGIYEKKIQDCDMGKPVAQPGKKNKII